MPLKSDRQSGKCIFCAFRQARRSISASQAYWGEATRIRHKGSGHDTFPFVGRRRRRRDDSDDVLQKRVPSRSYPMRQHDDGESSLSKGAMHIRLNPPLDGGGIRAKNLSPSNLPNVINAVLQERLNMLKQRLLSDPILQRLKLSEDKMKRQFKKFRSNFESQKDISQSPLMYRAKQLAASKDSNAVDQELKYAFYGAVLSSRLSFNDQQFQEKLLNLKHPGEWYPRTRGIQREFHVHVGPTNSGKTYHALKRLEQANSGVYAGPLRLLAHEVYMRLNARGKPCNLLTGDERKFQENPLHTAKMTSCTVEMLSLSEVFDVAVIDEVQMIGSEDRGWAWTQAVLGVMAREVHVCGEERAVPIIQELAAACGEVVKVHRYERLSPLKMMPQSLRGNLNQLEKGDCIVGFSIVMLHSLRQYVERVTKKKCAIIYGTLPPETRTQQAALFNDPDNDYDYLVASNAVGMGLNLSIKRLIFQSAYRNIRGRMEAVSVPEIKQIAGRAGRYSTASQDLKASVTAPTLEQPPTPHTETIQATDALSVVQDVSTSSVGSEDSSDQPNPQDSHAGIMNTVIDPTAAAADGMASSQAQAATSAPVRSESEASPIPPKPQNLGLVTTLEKLDHELVSKAMRTEPNALVSAAVLPPTDVVVQFSRYYPAGTPLAFLLIRLKELASTNRRFFHCDIKTQVLIADAIESVPGLSITDRLTFCSAPIETRREGEPELARAYASMLGEPRPANVLDVKELDIELLEDNYSPSKEYLKQLENLHKGLIIFNWLSFRFTGVFLDQALATHVKELVEKRIAETLDQLSFNYKAMRKTRDQALLDLLEDKEEGVESEQAVEEGAESETPEEVSLDAPQGDFERDVLATDFDHQFDEHVAESRHGNINQAHYPDNVEDDAHSTQDRNEDRRTPKMEHWPGLRSPDAPDIRSP